MNNIKNTFSIKDLENLTGIKSHTIRIWEKRYNLLKPDRTDTNIRLYDLTSLQKLLNISYLNNNGYKISKIAKLTEEEIPVLTKEIAIEDNFNDHALNRFKLSLINFDQTLFNTTYNNLTKTDSFTDIFYSIFIPLLNHIGLLWQTNTISPAQEHFIVELIKKKLLLNTEKAENEVEINDKQKNTYILFLPENEIHELGLLFINYTLALHGCKTVYLGQSVPQESLTDVLNYYKNAIFVSTFTIKPLENEIEHYLKTFCKNLLKEQSNALYVSGRMTRFIKDNTDKQVHHFFGVKNLIEGLNLTEKINSY